ncbi:MAG: VCBS domain-containing protein, partial [Prochlorococcaceae cyanobacterium]
LSRTAVGTYGTIVINEDGSYRYTADQDAADALDPGDEVTDLFTYTISDGETTDTAEIAIKVTGVNDQPTLNAIPAGTISDQENSTDLVTSNLTGTLTASDPDASASLSFGISAVSSTELRSQSNDIGLSATSTQAGTYGTLSLNTSTGAYNYTPNSAAIEALSAGDSVSDSFSLYASDGSLSASQSFQINITGATDPNSSSDSGSGSNDSSSSSSSTTNDQDDTALLSSKRQTNSFSTLTSDGQLQERYRSMPAAQKRDTGLGPDLNQFGLTSRNSDMELGTSNDGIGTALNIFGVTLLALLDPAEAIRAFLENLKGSGSKEVCEGADSWAGSEFCSQIDFEQQQAPALPLPTDVQGMAPQAQANPMANPAALGLEPLQSQADPWWPDQTAQGF